LLIWYSKYIAIMLSKTHSYTLAFSAILPTGSPLLLTGIKIKCKINQLPAFFIMKDILLLL